MSTSSLTKKQILWLQHIRNSQQFNGTLKLFAEQNDLKLNDLYRWRNSLRKKGLIVEPKKPPMTEPRFAKVFRSPVTNSASIQLRLGDLVISANQFPEPDWLAKLIHALELSS